MSRTERGSALWVVVVIGFKDARGVALRVVKLLGFKRPEKGGKANATQQKRDRDQDGEDFHLATLGAKRSVTP
jgi:hypothetical protein